jgi:hypothetical protein
MNNAKHGLDHQRLRPVRCTLDMLWIIHNFIRPHFTTRKVPAVALGIVEKGFSWEEVCMIQKTASF